MAKWTSGELEDILGAVDEAAGQMAEAIETLERVASLLGDATAQTYIVDAFKGIMGDMGFRQPVTVEKWRDELTEKLDEAIEAEYESDERSAA